MLEKWKCCGCGALSEDRERTCDCVTDILFRTKSRGNIENELKGKRKPTSCVHSSFLGHVKVGRLTDGENGPVTGYTADIRIECDDCGLSFRFRGQDYGSSPHKPMLSADGLELRAPIEPAYVTEIVGRPLAAGNA